MKLIEPNITPNSAVRVVFDKDWTISVIPDILITKSETLYFWMNAKGCLRTLLITAAWTL